MLLFMSGQGRCGRDDGQQHGRETKYGLNPNDPSDATGDFDKTGYTNIEKSSTGS
jgi:hypothetical protein